MRFRRTPLTDGTGVGPIQALTCKTAFVSMNDPMNEVRQALLRTECLFTRAEVLQRPSPVPAAAGVYAWYFTDPPAQVPLAGCHTLDGKVLLYVGISPDPAPRNGKPPSRQSLRPRIRTHFNGNAEGSTLRLTLGCLLAANLGIELRRVGSGTRMTFSSGEHALSEWMDQHARVAWVEHPAPWIPEEGLIRELVLPLNLDQNAHSGFLLELKAIRHSSREKARILPVLPR